MSAQELPKPIEVVLERGIGVREFRAWPDGWAWLDTFTPREAEPELVRELFKHKAELLHVQNELCDTLAADGCPFDDYILAAAMIDGKLVIAAWLHKEETENQL